MMTLNVYPDLIALTKLYTNLVHHLMHTDSWTSWTIIYDSIEGITKLAILYFAATQEAKCCT